MSKVLSLAALAAFSVLTASAGTLPARADAIPPNCTLDPFTHTMHCHKWPSCTTLPDGTLSCPEGGKLVYAGRASAQQAVR